VLDVLAGAHPDVLVEQAAEVAHTEVGPLRHCLQRVVGGRVERDRVQHLAQRLVAHRP
jgi:hypothetical protein